MDSANRTSVGKGLQHCHHCVWADRVVQDMNCRAPSVLHVCHAYGYNAAMIVQGQTGMGKAYTVQFMVHCMCVCLCVPRAWLQCGHDCARTDRDGQSIHCTIYGTLCVFVCVRNMQGYNAAMIAQGQTGT
eukprot:1161622-Pelagomonas_calceolata.AAC.19